MFQGAHRVSALCRTCAPFARAMSVALGAFDVRVRRTFSVRGAALQTSSQTYATNLASSLASSLCAPASRPYPEIYSLTYTAPACRSCL